jgi:hypothetical protein
VQRLKLLSLHADKQAEFMWKEEFEFSPRLRRACEVKAESLTDANGPRRMWACPSEKIGRCKCASFIAKLGQASRSQSFYDAVKPVALVLCAIGVLSACMFIVSPLESLRWRGRASFAATVCIAIPLRLGVHFRKEVLPSAKR